MFLAEKYLIMTNLEWDECKNLPLWATIDAAQGKLKDLQVYEMPLEHEKEGMIFIPANRFCEAAFKGLLKRTTKLTQKERYIYYMMATAYTKTVSYAPTTKKLPYLAFVGLIRACITDLDVWKVWQTDFTKNYTPDKRYILYVENDASSIVEYTYAKH